LEGKAQIYTATLDDCGNDKTQYRRDIFNAWNIGAQKSDGGLLILVCWYGGDKSRRSVEVKTDEKMQRVISDALTAATAQNNFVPAFKENRPGAGLVKMVSVFDSAIRGKASTLSFPVSWTEIKPFLFILVVIFVIAIMLKGKKGNGGDGSWYGGFDGGGGGDSGGGDGGGSSTSF
jgi:uncharacterized membrane protein YgcG